MNQRIKGALLSALLLFSLTACAPKTEDPAAGETKITLSDTGVQVNGKPAPSDGPVRIGGELIYYHDNTDDTYGAGDESEQHSAEEAAAHTLVTITQPGTYRVSGTLTKGQLMIDLGEEAETDPTAVVTLILDNADITCTVAPAVFFYRVYECGSTDPDAASPDVDTSAAGANVILAADSENHITGSHVAKIYQEGTTKKLHKYDGAFYSCMSMNLSGENGSDSGALYITADHEGLDSELHLTIHSGTISIDAENDGINTNEDGVSVTTINGGNLTVNGGLGAEGDGIDSNGYLTINGGVIYTSSNEQSPDGGIDADLAIHIHGGTVAALGTRNDSVSGQSTQPSMELNFKNVLPAGTTVAVQDEQGNEVLSITLRRACQSLTLSDRTLMEGKTYQILVNGVRQTHSGTSDGGFGPMPPDGQTPPDMPDPGDRPEPPMQGEPPEGGMTPPEGEPTTEFTLTSVAARFQNVS